MKSTIVIDGKTYTQFPTITRNDYGFGIQFNIKQNDDSAYNLLNKTVIFKTKKLADSVTTVSSECVITNYTSGIAIYTVQQSDLATTGVYISELQLNGSSFEQTVQLGKLFIQEDL